MLGTRAHKAGWITHDELLQAIAVHGHLLRSVPVVEADALDALAELGEWST